MSDLTETNDTITPDDSGIIVKPDGSLFIFTAFNAEGTLTRDQELTLRRLKAAAAVIEHDYTFEAVEALETRVEDIKAKFDKIGYTPTNVI